MLEMLLSSGVFLLAAVLTGWFRKYALRSSLLDLPNKRSSHTVPTPRGGGAAIVCATLTGMALAWVLGAATWPSLIAFAGAGGLVASVGYADDRHGLRARWRLLGHFSAAVWLLHWSGGTPPILFVGGSLITELALSCIAVLGIVWLTNLTNFIDGIDGLAAAQVVTVCLSGWLLWYLMETAEATWIPPLLLASAALGFLMWNWPPAKIFMGDVGSGFLGIFLAGLTIQSGWVAAPLFWAWVVLLGTSVVDATVTLIRRMFRGETLYHPHRTHAYQHAARRLGSHRPVTVVVCAINVGWLLPVAYLAASERLAGPVAVALGYAPLMILAVRLNAGVKLTV